MSIKYKIKKNPFGNESKDLIENIGGCIIPRDLNNMDYQQFLQDVKEQGIEIVEGDDVVTPDYKQQRLSEYPSIEDQLDKIYHTSLTAWKSDIKAVKDKYPKTNSSSTTVGSVPSWVQEEVDKLP
tara:strand:+ start:50 stop:424 length:375 start_codon:yes stop_codon:yes gene_type:complete